MFDFISLFDALSSNPTPPQRRANLHTWDVVCGHGPSSGHHSMFDFGCCAQVCTISCPLMQILLPALLCLVFTLGISVHSPACHRSMFDFISPSSGAAARYCLQACAICPAHAPSPPAIPCLISFVLPALMPLTFMHGCAMVEPCHI